MSYSYQDALHMEQDFVSYLENGNLEDAETLYGTIHAMFGSCADSSILSTHLVVLIHFQ